MNRMQSGYLYIEYEEEVRVDRIMKRANEIERLMIRWNHEAKKRNKQLYHKLPRTNILFLLVCRRNVRR